MKHFINTPASAVGEAIDGLIATSGGTLIRLDGYPDVKVVLRSDLPLGKVALISGGGAGHEPAHIGYVAPGLLSAAVSGEIFASPSADAVLAAILACPADAGCLLIVMNYTGDRLSFGLAAERAKALGRQVEMVVVGDDVALGSEVQARGLIGTVLVHKIAGAFAERGESLATVRDVAELVARTACTFAVSLGSADVPGRDGSPGKTPERLELGLGIHGEPGAGSIELVDADQVARELSTRVLAAVADRTSDAPLAVAINNLGGVSSLELGIISRTLLAGELGDRTELVIGPAPLMTSFNMRGLSVTALPLDDELHAALRAPVAAWSPWPEALTHVASSPLRPVPDAAHATSRPPSGNPRRRRLLLALCDAMITAEPRLNELDGKVGDGDTGTSVATAARRIRDTVNELPLAETASLLGALSDLVGRTMAGSSGVLLATMFASAATAVDNGAKPVSALLTGACAMQAYGGASEGDRTMLDALLPALRALDQCAPVVDAARAARAGADATASMVIARAGRSSYVGSEHLRGVIDPGAEAIALCLEALAASCA